jgi:hypothetical protein
MTIAAGRWLHIISSWIIFLLIIVTSGSAHAQNVNQLTIEQLLKDGWSIAGYAAQGTTFILLKNESRSYLVQCSVLYDTTRGARAAERVKTNCYELH